MDSFDHSLQRLLNAAATARKETPEHLPRTVEARVLAQWRAMGAEDEFALLVRLFRRATISAFVLMALSCAWNYYENKSEAGTMALASYAIKMQLPP